MNFTKKNNYKIDLETYFTWIPPNHISDDHKLTLVHFRARSPRGTHTPFPLPEVRNFVLNSKTSKIEFCVFQNLLMQISEQRLDSHEFLSCRTLSFGETIWMAERFSRSERMKSGSENGGFDTHLLPWARWPLSESFSIAVQYTCSSVTARPVIFKSSKRLPNLLLFCFNFTQYLFPYY